MLSMRLVRTTRRSVSALLRPQRRALHRTNWNAMSAAITTVNVPSMGDSISEGTVASIERQVGELVRVDEAVVVIETDKVSIDIKTPVAGRVVEHFAAVDDNVAVGKPLFTIDTSVAVDDHAPATSAPQQVVGTPAPEPAVASAPAPQPRKRTPLIRFLGKRSLLLAASPVAQAAPSSPVQMVVVRSSDQVLGFQHAKRIPISAVEIDMINNGLAFL